jgi:Flp pilus assembly pilin Flp
MDPEGHEVRQMVFGLPELVRAFARSVRGERGAVSVEYASLLVFLALAVIGGLTALAVAVVKMFQDGAGAF